MSREIKFRAWDSDSKNMYNADEIDHWSLGRVHKGDHTFTFLQYTGLKDKNGVEIYEGDITKWHYGGNWKIRWSDGHSNIGEPDDEWGDYIGFIIVSQKAGEDGYLIRESLTSDRIYEVIGNVWENPELLEVKE